FEATTIEAYETDEPVDLLVSLHACDTATDEAIAAGVRLGAKAIVVVPCCHHELAGQISANEKDGILRHGLLLARQADLVTDALQAKIAEDAGACAVMALERVPADIRRDGGVARMSDPDMVKGIQEAVTIPVMAKCRIGHFAEAQILQSLEIDYIDESEVLTPADLEHHVDKWQFTVPFVCGCTNLGEALRRIAEGAAMIRTKGEAG